MHDRDTCRTLVGLFGLLFCFLATDPFLAVGSFLAGARFFGWLFASPVVILGRLLTGTGDGSGSSSSLRRQEQGQRW